MKFFNLTLRRKRRNVQAEIAPTAGAKLQKLWKTLLCVTLMITAVELAQLFTLVGSCDVDDLLLNLLGAGLGYGLYKLTQKPDC